MTADDDQVPTDALYALAVRSSGVHFDVGPVDIGEGLLLVDEHAVPNGWTVEFIPLMSPDHARRALGVAPTPDPAAVEAADLFVALRRAIITDQDNDGADCPRAAALITRLEAHRPLQLWTGDEECLLSECDHPDGQCPTVRKAMRLCAACSVVYDSGSEWGPEWLPEARVAWPCALLLKVTGHYQIDLTLASS